MVSFGKGAESLAEVLALCEQTLAALDLRASLAAPQPGADGIGLPAQRRRAKLGRRFRLIIGGMNPPRRTGITR
jgi:hypothetical protein